jgi:hypothetical protein
LAKDIHTQRLVSMTSLVLLTSAGACSPPTESAGEGVVSTLPSTQTARTAADSIAETDRRRSEAAPRPRLSVEWVPDTLSYTVRNEQDKPVMVSLEARANQRGSTKAVALPPLELAPHEAMTRDLPLDAVTSTGAAVSGPVQLFLRASARAGSVHLERAVSPAIFVERRGESVVIQDSARRIRSLSESAPIAPSDLGVDPRLRSLGGTTLALQLAGTGEVRRMTEAEWLASQTSHPEATGAGTRAASMDKLSSKGGH